MALKRLLITLFVFGMFTTMVVCTQMEAYHAKKMMEKYDKNRDGKFSLAEYIAPPPAGSINADVKALMEEQFQAGDADKDGFITREEMPALVQHLEGKGEHHKPEDMADLAKKMLEEDDTDGDGKVSFAEFMAPSTPPAPSIDAADSSKMEEDFREADADNDGFISAEETSALMKIQKRREDMVDHDEMDEENDMETEAVEMMESYDKDGNGKVSLAEFLAPPGDFEEGDFNAEDYKEAEEMMEQAFQAGDADKDGFITAEEMPALIEQLNVMEDNDIVGQEEEEEQDKGL